MGALDHAVRSGKALYVGLSNYRAPRGGAGHRAPARAGHALPHPPAALQHARSLARAGAARRCWSARGWAPSPSRRSAQGLLTNRYFSGIPADSRAGHDPRFLRPEHVTDEVLGRTRKLDALARGRGQTLAQLALAWVLRRAPVTSALIGASRPSQVDDCVGAAKRLAFSDGELAEIERILAG